MKLLTLMLACSTLCFPLTQLQGEPSDSSTNPIVLTSPDSFPPDTPINQYQLTLLKFGFEGASFMPVDPHIKTRSLLQQDVIQAYLDHDQPAKALELIPSIADWRQAYSYSELAHYLAEHGDLKNAAQILAKADQLSKNAEDWKLSNIRVRMAQTYVLLGDHESAKKYAEGVDTFLQGKVEQTANKVADDDTFTTQVAALKRVFDSQVFEAQQNSTDGLIQLYDRFYVDTEKRALLEKQILSNLELFPIILRFEKVSQLSEAASSNEDFPNALRLADVAQTYVDDYAYFPQDHLKLLATLALLRYNAGEKERGVSEVDKALDLFNAKRDSIEPLSRASGLRPIAEAYAEMDKPKNALEVFRRAFNDGSENPNIRPRSKDYVANCISMAKSGVEPDEDLLKTIEKIHTELDPAQ